MTPSTSSTTRRPSSIWTTSLKVLPRPPRRAARHPALLPVLSSHVDAVPCRAEGQGIDMDDADAVQVALAVRPPSAILAMDDTGALERVAAAPGPPCGAQ